MARRQAPRPKVVPYAELYRIAEECHKNNSEDQCRELCKTAADEYGKDFIEVQKQVKAIYFQEFL